MGQSPGRVYQPIHVARLLRFVRFVSFIKSHDVKIPRRENFAALSLSHLHGFVSLAGQGKLVSSFFHSVGRPRVLRGSLLC